MTTHDADPLVFSRVVAPEAGSMVTPGTDASIAERYRLLNELLPDAIAVHQDGIVVYVNRAALAFAEVDSRDQMIGVPISDYVHPDELPRMVDRILGMGDEPGASTEPEIVLMRNGAGTEKLMEVTSVRTEWDNAPAYQVIMRDISAQKEAEAALRAQAALVDHVSDAVIAVDMNQRIRSWNPAAEQMYGLVAEEAIGTSMTSAMGTSIRPSGAVALGGTVDEIHRRADTGREFAARMAVTMMDDGYLIVSEAARRPLFERLGTILAALHQAVIVVRDGDGGHIELANPAATAMLGLEDAEIPGLSTDSLSIDFLGDTSPIKACLSTGAVIHDITATIATPQGRRWLSCSVRPIDDDTNEAAALVSIVDITDRHQEASRLAWEATHDFLTGLLNRAGLVAALSNHLRALSGPDQRVGVYYLDLDGFKAVNDTRGHAAGDELLKIVGQRLDDMVDCGPSVVGRIGGDEFIIAATLSSKAAEQIGDHISHIRGVVSEPIDIGGRRERVTTSIGVAMTSAAQQQTPEDLLRDADIALYEAKRTNGRASYVQFEVRHRRDLERRRSIERHLRMSLTEHPEHFRLDYQPIVATSTQRVIGHRVVGMEALLRWRHPVFGLVPPAEFIPLAERSDLIDLIGAHVFDTAATALASNEWPDDAMLSLNMSRSGMTAEDFLPRLDGLLDRLLRDTIDDPSRLCIEVTESSLDARDSEALATLSAVRERGVHVALDDFGTGASSLSELYRLPISILKTAKAFVDALDQDDRAEAILSSIVSMAHATGTQVIAEGIETKAQAQAVARIGCDYAQGYYFGFPRPIGTRPQSKDSTEWWAGIVSQA
ncbi:sensor domain-containing protein [Gordonia soli]|uniref:Putative signaling protein n=1 Tax=Gordonia soli NBRC 108243 TaxID=1223545 RepID=M0QKZ8_9ACTN|nr:EAL domain-containing protein [Gordonia soli]GAC69233.1 putative signaling protein [Gordonia soli NBRC 108243]